MIGSSLIKLTTACACAKSQMVSGGGYMFRRGGGNAGGGFKTPECTHRQGAVHQRSANNPNLDLLPLSGPVIRGRSTRRGCLWASGVPDNSECNGRRRSR